MDIPFQYTIVDALAYRVPRDQTTKNTYRSIYAGDFLTLSLFP